jgi:hypothetical protein
MRMVAVLLGSTGHGDDAAASCRSAIKLTILEDQVSASGTLSPADGFLSYGGLPVSRRDHNSWCTAANDIVIGAWRYARHLGCTSAERIAVFNVEMERLLRCSANAIHSDAETRLYCRENFTEAIGEPSSSGRPASQAAPFRTQSGSSRHSTQKRRG